MELYMTWTLVMLPTPTRKASGKHVPDRRPPTNAENPHLRARVS